MLCHGIGKELEIARVPLLHDSHLRMIFCPSHGRILAIAIRRKRRFIASSPDFFTAQQLPFQGKICRPRLTLLSEESAVKMVGSNIFIINHVLKRRSL
jgi:hypothetical protein